MSDIKQTLIKLWQSACIDTPIRNSCRVEDGQFVLEINGNRAAWVDLIAASGVPTTATQEIIGISVILQIVPRKRSALASLILESAELAVLVMGGFFG